MATDLTGGLGEDREFVFGAQPEDPEMRESVNAWIWDSGTESACPGSAWRPSPINGRPTMFRSTSSPQMDGSSTSVAPGKVHDPFGPDGRPRVLGAGPLSFELIKPFEHWKMRLDGRTAREHS